MYTEISNAEMADVPSQEVARKQADLTDLDQILPLLEAAKTPAGAVDAVSSPSQAAGLPKAKIVLALGRGANQPETIALAKQVAEKLGAEIGVTRPMVGSDFNRGQQLGVNGHKIKPQVLINLGIAGAPQYTFTVDHAENIISVNTNPNAIVFEGSDYRYVGSTYDFLNELLNRLG